MSKKREILTGIILAVLGAVFILVSVFAVVFAGELKTLFSIRKETEGFYYMRCSEDLKFDELLEADINSLDELTEWIANESLHGLPISLGTEGFGCSTFVCQNPEGDTLMGRNFDYVNTDALMVYCDPPEGYASYGMADLEVLGVSDGNIDPDSVTGRLYMLAAPYVCLDGVNEAGLSIGILETSKTVIRQDNGKPDLLIYCAIRGVLDNCADVGEAIDFLSNYDIQSSLGVAYHLQIADKSGRAVVVEWLDGQMSVVESNAATNSVLTPGEHFGEGSIDSRIDTIQSELENCGGVMTEEDAKCLLEAVCQDSYTEWSCVYNLDDFSVTVYLDADYGTGYNFG